MKDPCRKIYEATVTVYSRYQTNPILSALLISSFIFTRHNSYITDVLEILLQINLK